MVFERTETPEQSSVPRVDVMQPEPYHYVTNTSNQDYRAVRIELKNTSTNANQYFVSPSDALYQSSEGVLVGNIGTTIKVKHLADLSEVSPLNLNGEKRIAVWHLSKDVSYIISSQTYEKAHLLKV
ncbi:MAG: hypothetical protein HWD61_00440 [Parachlamydiaceae bacterium]|nr:MAG: hypothetical protein HWD61_00440 [Parachlamydiaceae bacterium]